MGSDAPVDKKALARSSPAGLAWYCSGGKEGGELAWIPAEHLLILSQKLVDVAAGRIPRLIVTMPPRHGKSELISKYTPAWFLGTFPDKKVMLTSYADTFAAQWGRRARDILKEFGPELWGVSVDPETSGGQLWEVDGHDGIMVTAGLSGGLTGKGGHLLIIDDPVKNSQEAQSEVTRDAHHDWWKSTARTRLQKGAGVVLVMTRWHEDDLAGRLLQDAENDEGDQWEILNLPGLAEAPDDIAPDELASWRDPLGRKVGDPLWPQMFDREALLQTKKAMGTYWFTAMYQQRPAPAEGMLFKAKNFRYYTRDESGILTLHKDNDTYLFDPDYGIKFSTMDVAASESEDADFTVFSTWLVTPQKDLVLYDRERVKFEGPDLAPFVRRKFYELRPSIIGIERLGYGLTIIQELLREGLPIIRLEPDKDKVSRALPACARYEEHRIFHPTGDGYGWVKEEWEPELLSFPNAAHDDQVDTVAYAALQLPMLGFGGMRGGGTPEAVESATRAARSHVRGTGNGVIARGLQGREL
jgi:predicted phage terminase large subunit-like protein